MEVVIIITWVEVEEVEVIVEQVEQAEERGEAQILNIKSDANSKYQILEVLGLESTAHQEHPKKYFLGCKIVNFNRMPTKGLNSSD